MTADIPNPGSPEAVAKNCSCPQIDNAGGLGIGGNGAKNGWVMTEGCPVHGSWFVVRSEPTGDIYDEALAREIGEGEA